MGCDDFEIEQLRRELREWINAYPSEAVTGLAEECPETALMAVMTIEGLIDGMRDDVLEGLGDAPLYCPEALGDPRIAQAYRSIERAVGELDGATEGLREAWAELDEALSGTDGSDGEAPKEGIE